MSRERIAGCTLALPIDTLSAWRDGALLAAEMAQVDAHLPGCAACRARLAEYDAVAHALRLLAVPEPVGGYGHNPRRWQIGAADRERPHVRTLPHGMGPARSRDGVRPRLRATVEVVAALLLVSLLGGLLAWQRQGGHGTSTTLTVVQWPAPSPHERSANRYVSEGDLTPTTVSCPAGALALSGGWALPDYEINHQGTVIQSARTLDGEGWAVVVENTDPSPVNVWALVICLGSAPPGTKVIERSQTITVPSSQTSSATATCQGGELAVGGGFAGHHLQITQHGASGDAAWDASAYNPTSSDAQLMAYAECLTASGAHLTVQADQQPPIGSSFYSQSVDVQPLNSHLSAVQCPIGSFIVGGGFSTYPGIAAVYENGAQFTSAQYDHPQFWAAELYNPTKTVQTLSTSATCLSFA
jgi:hypothetical protein